MCHFVPRLIRICFLFRNVCGCFFSANIANILHRRIFKVPKSSINVRYWQIDTCQITWICRVLIKLIHSYFYFRLFYRNAILWDILKVKFSYLIHPHENQYDYITIYNSFRCWYEKIFDTMTRRILNITNHRLIYFQLI